MLHYKKITSLILLSLFISGCSVDNNGFEKYPEKKLAESYPVSNIYNINTKWWQDYNDPQLNSLIQKALNNNTDLAQTAINVNLALYQANMLGADLVPTFSSSLSGNASKNLKEGGNSTTSVSGNVSVSYELDLWKRLANSKDASVWNYKASQEDLEEAKLALINNVISSYFKLKYLNEYYNLTNDNLKNYQQLLSISDSKLKYGIISNLDVVQAQQSVAQSQNTLNDINLQIKQTEQTLKNLLNYAPTNQFIIDKISLLDIKLQGVDINVPVSTIANRPDLKAEEYSLLSLFKDKTAQEKSMYPSITLSSAISSSGTKINNSFSVPIGSVGVAINLPFLDWNHIKWNVKTSQANFEKQKYAFSGAITTALNEIDTFYYTYQSSITTYKNDENMYKNAKKITNYYKIRYDSGIADMSDYLNAIQSENNYKQAILQAKYNLIVNQNNIYKAMAGKYKI